MNKFLVALIAALTLALALASMAGAAEPGKQLRVKFFAQNGMPLPKASIIEFICRDLNDEPLVVEFKLQDGFADVTLPNQPCGFSARIPTPGFGEVVLFADAKGKGYTQSGTIDFVKEAAATRMSRVQTALQQAKADGVNVADYAARLKAAEGMTSYKSLASTLTLGEEITLARARHRIEKLNNPRKGFLFGCNAFGYPARGPLYEQRFQELFNYGTANLYLTRYAYDPDNLDFARTDSEIAKLHSWGMTAKACPPFYLAAGVTPEWLKQQTWPEVNASCYKLMLASAKHFAGRVPFCEITNEATMSNGLRLTTEQIIEYTRTAANATRDGDPNVRRIINSAHLWGDYASRLDSRGQPRLSPYAYLKACINAEIPFEITGLQLYYPEFDLMEIDRMLEKYAKLGKPIHITEMGCSSIDGLDPNAQRKKAAAGWHGPWTEEMQADWVEGVYTIFYSKPYIEAVSWWDLADAVSFWPSGGFLRGDCSPKPSFDRLRALQTKWGFRFSAKQQ